MSVTPVFFVMPGFEATVDVVVPLGNGKAFYGQIKVNKDTREKLMRRVTHPGVFNKTTRKLTYNGKDLTVFQTTDLDE